MGRFSYVREGERPSDGACRPFRLRRKGVERGFADLSRARVLREGNRIGGLVDVRIEHVPLFVTLERDAAVSVLAFRTGEDVGEIRLGIARRKSCGYLGRASRRIRRIANAHRAVSVLNRNGVAPRELDSEDAGGVFTGGLGTEGRSRRRTFGGTGRDPAHRHACGLAAAVEGHSGDLRVEFLNLGGIRPLFSEVDAGSEKVRLELGDFFGLVGETERS